MKDIGNPKSTLLDTICIELQPTLVFVAGVKSKYNRLPKPNFELHDYFNQNYYSLDPTILGHLCHMIFLNQMTNHICSPAHSSVLCFGFGFRNHN